jgi:cell division protein FtsI (penicillin-binding protein 3)
MQLRIRLIGAVFVVAFLAIAARAGYLQLVMAADLGARGNQQQQRVIKLTPKRGDIYDRNGEELALSIEVKSLYANPTEIKEPKRVAAQLARLLDIPEKRLRDKLSRKKSFIWIERRLSPEIAQQVGDLKLAGLHFVPEHKRYYPRGQVAAQVVGFTGLDPKGLEGIELFYDADLLGEAGLLISARDARGRGMATAEQDIRGGVPGGSIYLTIDRTLQYIAEKELARQVKASSAVGGTVVMIEPASGRVLAMASQPSYNPNAINRYRPGDWRNRTVSDAFEPGSIFKPFLLAGVLEEGLLSPSSKIDCENGRFEVGGKVIRDHKGYGRLNLADMLKYSSNIGFAKIGKKLERERLYGYLRDFGFGQKTGVDLPGEEDGVLRNPNRWFEIDLATASFGQGVSVTPLQMAAAMGAIANGGMLMEPYLVERIVDGQGEVYRHQPNAVRRVVSESTANRVKKMMVGVTESGGTGTRGAVIGYKVAGKTGTAQKVDSVTGGYSVDKTVSSFIGMVPADNPAMLMLVTIDEPQDMTYGGLVAAPVFSRIAEESLRYLDIPTTEMVVKQQLPEKRAKVASAKTKTTEPAVALDGELSKMPDFAGMSYRQVLETMSRNGLNIKLTGSGKAVEQSPRAGELIRYGTKIWVRFGA